MTILPLTWQSDETGKEPQNYCTRLAVRPPKKPTRTELDKLFTKNQNKLFYVCKMVDGNPTQYKKSTPNDVMYENMDEYIHGNGAESSKKRAASQFLEISLLSMEELKIRALIKDSLYYRFITTKAGGWIEPIDSGIRLGKSPSECLEFLKNPENEETLMSLLNKVEPYWNS